MAIEDDFYCTIKLKCGDEIFCKVAATEEEDRTLLLLSNPITVEEIVVRGTVTDVVTGEPIANAKVSDDGYGLQPYKGATTDSEGRYEYFTWPEEHSIRAEAPGYKIQRKGLTGLFHVETEDQKVIDFALEPE